MARLQGIFFVSIVLDARHHLTAVDNKTRESIIPQQQQLGQVMITVFISTLGLHSQACQSMYRLSNYWFHNTKLVECFQSDGPRA